MEDKLDLLREEAYQVSDGDEEYYESYLNHLITYESGIFTMAQGGVDYYDSEGIEVDDFEEAEDFIRKKHRKWEKAIGVVFPDGKVIIGGYEST